MHSIDEEQSLIKSFADTLKIQTKFEEIAQNTSSQIDVPTLDCFKFEFDQK